ncbi:MAG: hypothetical protein HQK55_05210 [Deltaproteobacteria bacterium]|nr:hypothetical protein [Deltaproteobacteria bacterium]
MKKVMLLLLLAFFLIATGCSFSKGAVAKKWSEAVRELLVTPVFPPREDIQVGDIYADNLPTAESTEMMYGTPGLGKYLDLNFLIATIDFQSNLKLHYSKRFQFPKTQVPDYKQDANQTQKVQDELTTMGTANIFDSGPRNRLPHLGLPEFSYTSLNDFSMEAILPINPFNVFLGLKSGDYQNMAIKFRSCESYGIPVAEALAKLVTDYGLKKYFVQDVKRAIDSITPGQRSFLIVTEVYTAREFDITAKFSKSFFATASTSTHPNMIPETTWEKASFDERLKFVDEINKRVVSYSDPAGYFRLVELSDQDITMNRVYYRLDERGEYFCVCKGPFDPKSGAALSIGDGGKEFSEGGTMGPLFKKPEVRF